MNDRRFARAVVAAAALLPLIAAPAPAAAYGGPGSIVSGIGALLAVVGAVAAAIFGFLWFPLKRLYRKLRGDEESGAGEAQETEKAPDIGRGADL